MENKETVNQVETTTTQSDKSFTQAEVDAIISDRLKRERAKYEGFDEIKKKAEKLDEIEEASKTELQKATEKALSLEAEIKKMKAAEAVRAAKEKVANELGVPITLLQGETEETCREQAAAILDFAKNRSGYPSVKDGGEVTSFVNKGTPEQKFAEWWNNQI